MTLSRGIIATAVGTLLLLGQTACSGGEDSTDDDGDGDRGPTSSTAGDQEPAQFRKVVAAGDPSACTTSPTTQPAPDSTTTACDLEGVAHQLGPAELVGGVDRAEAAEGPDGGWLITIDLDTEAAATFADLTTELSGTGQQVAIVSGGTIVSAPTIQTPITDGRVQITGPEISQVEALTLADALEAD
ncbi:hypothetical protein CFH99_20980 [Nocardioides aromaticivorans]|uniref:SecDF P1 head subdomain domain-containing protein n=1 Tax=Nocardioides aromaticivorans TaxID=200618 RepID=A0ABX7PQ06_9ACTN|nr:hypothetical protein [Nocardioides aromaticivorans]QSR28098.1 hypothetical protein CFH99_20980 [Nocardioides aromaticivorans]